MRGPGLSWFSNTARAYVLLCKDCKYFQNRVFLVLPGQLLVSRRVAIFMLRRAALGTIRLETLTVPSPDINNCFFAAKALS